MDASTLTSLSSVILTIGGSVLGALSSYVAFRRKKREF